MNRATDPIDRSSYTYTYISSRLEDKFEWKEGRETAKIPSSSVPEDRQGVRLRLAQRRHGTARGQREDGYFRRGWYFGRRAAHRL